MAVVSVYHLTRRDTVYTARELLRQAEPESEVWLVLPWRVAWARKQVNLELLKRMAYTANVDLHLVTRHIETREMAIETGLRVHTFIPISLAKNEQSTTTPEAESRFRNAKRRAASQQERKSFSVGSALWGLATVLLLVGVLGGVMAIFVPQAEVTIKPQAEPVEAQFTVTVNTEYTSIDYGRAMIPGKSVQVIVEGRGESAASGSTEIAGTHATGNVVFANRTSQTVTVPQGTIVRTSSSSPVRFYTTADVEIAGQINAIASVQVISVDAGLENNVNAWTINVVEGELANSVSVLNAEGLYGGGNTSVPVIATEDFTTVRDETIELLGSQAYEQLLAELDEGEFIPADTLEVLVMSQEYDQVVGQQSDTISISMKVVARGTVISSDDLTDLAMAMLESKATTGTSLIESSIAVSRSATLLNDDGNVTMTLEARGMAAPEIDTEALLDEIAGKSSDKAIEILMEAVSLTEEPTIDISPESWNKLPYLQGRITFNVSAQVPEE